MTLTARGTRLRRPALTSPRRRPSGVGTRRRRPGSLSPPGKRRRRTPVALEQASSALLSWTLDSGVATQEPHLWSYKRRTWSPTCPCTILRPVGTSGPVVPPLSSIYRLPPVLTSFNGASRAPHPHHSLPNLLTPLAHPSHLPGSSPTFCLLSICSWAVTISQPLRPVLRTLPTSAKFSTRCSSLCVCPVSSLSKSTPLSTCKSLACSPNLPVFDLQGPPLNKEQPPKRCPCMGLS